MTAVRQSVQPLPEWLLSESANAQRSLQFPDLAPWWPELCDIDPGVDPLEVARRGQRLARIYEWEDRPTDPDEDVAELLADYPTLRRDHDAMCELIRASPIYAVVRRAGEELRQELLAAAAAYGGWDESEAELFFEERVCRCELRGHREFADGSPVLRRHRDAGRCRWCVIRRVLEEKRHRENCAAIWGCTVEEAGRQIDEAERQTVASGDAWRLEPDWMRW